VLLLVALIVVGGFGLASSTEEQRAKLRQALAIASAIPAAIARHNSAACAPFFEAQRARMRFAWVTIGIVALNVLVFTLMVFGKGAISDPDTLVGWGANFGPRTTNGEWWRLVTSTFIHAGLMALVVNLVAFAQLGLVLERIVGRLTLAAVYAIGGLLAGLIGIAAHPVIVSAGASGAIAAVYGLMIACGIWDFFRPTETPIPPAVAKRLVPAAALFVFYNAFDGGIEMQAEFLSFGAGLLAGLALTSRAGSREPQQRMLGIAAGAMATLAIIVAFSLRGIADVRPEIARVLDIEGQTVPGFRAAEALVSKGKIDTTTLADLIEVKIMPQLRATRDHLVALRGVPREHQQLVADAEEYLQLRYESWRLRAQGLRRVAAPLKRDPNGGMAADARWRDRASNEHRVTQVMLGRAEGTERQSLEVLQRLKPQEHPEVQ
jgi:membrane associated rhomboid family serine protease